MSEYELVKTEYKDEECLRQALERASAANGWRFEEGESLALYGYMGKRRKERAQFVIRRQYVGRAANDIGFARNEDGSYSLIISEFDQGQDNGRAKLLNPIKIQYTRAISYKAAEMQGMEVYAEERNAAGEIVLKVRKKRRKVQRVIKNRGRRLRVRS